MHPARPIGRVRTHRGLDRRASRRTRHPHRPDLTTTGRSGQTVIGDKNYVGAAFEATLAGARSVKPLRQVIKSINDTFRKPYSTWNVTAGTAAGVTLSVLQRILALTGASWNNDRISAPPNGRCSLTTTVPLGVSHLRLLR